MIRSTLFRSHRPASNNVRIILFAISLALWVSHSAAAHPFHVSTAEANWNPESKMLEVAVKLDVLDLQNAVRQSSQTKVQITDVQAADALVQKYVRTRLQFRLGDKKELAEWTWVGYEVDLKSAWLYLELPLPNGAAELKISNTLLFGDVFGQVNYMTIQQADQHATVRCTAKDKWQDVQLQAGKAKPITLDSLQPNHK
ncbi:MAG: DUF6702 family protein [Pirellulaceae bacterium]